MEIKKMIINMLFAIVYYMHFLFWFALSITLWTFASLDLINMHSIPIDIFVIIGWIAFCIVFKIVATWFMSTSAPKLFKEV